MKNKYEPRNKYAPNWIETIYFGIFLIAMTHLTLTLVWGTEPAKRATPRNTEQTEPEPGNGTGNPTYRPSEVA